MLHKSDSDAFIHAHSSMWDYVRHCLLFTICVLRRQSFQTPVAQMGGHRAMWLLSALLMIVLPSAFAELTPPYFNLAEGRKISASSTCGIDIDDPELYCKLVGSHTDDQQNKTALFDYHDDHFHTPALSQQGNVVIQGQVRVIKSNSGD